MSTAQLLTSNEVSLQSSALAALQDKLVHGSRVSEGELTRALTDDIERGVQLSEVFLVKFSRAPILSEASRRALITHLQLKMSRVLFSDPRIFLNYSKAAVILAGKCPVTA